MNKAYAILAAFLLGITLVGTSFYYGTRYQKNKDDAAQNQARVEALQKKIDQALEIADKFATIAKEFTAKISQAKEVTKTITKTQVQYVDRYIQDHPEVASCITVPVPVLGLRNCQIDRIRKAAGYSVPERSDGDVCPSGLSDQ